MKKNTTMNLSENILYFLEQESQNLSISRNDMIESLLISYLAQQNTALTAAQIHEFVDNFPLKKRGNNSPAFRSTIRTLPPQDAWTLVTFFTKINLIEEIEVSINRFSNLWKRSDPICYFAYGNTIARQSVSNLLNNQAGNVAQIVSPSSFGGSFYLSCLQQLKHPQIYPHWGDFLQILELRQNTTIISVDGFSLIHTILPALKKL